MCVCLSVLWLSDRRQTLSLNQSTDLVQIWYLGSSHKYLEPFFIFSLSLKLRVVHIRKFVMVFEFLKNGNNEIDQILWDYSTFETQ